MKAPISVAVLALIGHVSAAELEREPLLTWAPTPKKGDHPVDYFVPNFGVDHDIASTQDNIKNTEAKLGHKLAYVPKKDRPAEPPRDYFVPNFGVDHDIVSTQNNLADTEDRLGIKMSYTPKKDRPAEPPRDYFVPNFGVDKDIETT